MRPPSGGAVLLALEFLSFNLEDTGPRITLVPTQAFSDTAGAGDGVPLLVPPAASAPGSSPLPSAWSCDALGGSACSVSAPMWPLDGAAGGGAAGSGSVGRQAQVGSGEVPREHLTNLTTWLEAAGWVLDGASPLTANLTDGFPGFSTALSDRLLDTLVRSSLAHLEPESAREGARSARSLQTAACACPLMVSAICSVFEQWAAKQAGSLGPTSAPVAALSLSYTEPSGSIPLPAPHPPIPPIPFSLEVPTLLFQSKQMHALPTLSPQGDPTLDQRTSHPLV